MNKRAFLKCISCLPFLGWVKWTPSPKRYLTQCRWEDVIGLRFEWPAQRIDNPFPGRDWEIVEQAPRCFQYEGYLVDNRRMNKYWARPVGLKEPLKLTYLDPMWNSDGDVDYQTVDLRWGKFYRA